MILLGVLTFFAGFSLGIYLKGFLFTRLEWNLLKWDNDIFAYRPARKGTLIQPNDKVFMALRVPTSDMPKEGYRYE